MKNNKNNHLMASIAVFAELSDTKNDLQSIIVEFIKSIYRFEEVISLNSIEVMQLLKKHFEFDIPEAVIRSCLKRMSNTNILKNELGKYYLIDKNYDFSSFSLKLNQKRESQDAIEKELLQYFEKIINHNVTVLEKKELIDSFISYLLDNNVSVKYSTLISSFIVERSKNENFISNLNQIKEGIVLITGLKYTDDLNQLGNWNEELTIYLDTEHLFNSEGFNGEIYQKLFNDFYMLVNEINLYSSKKHSKNLIQLKYFEDVKTEIDKFFYVAEKVLKREENSSPKNTAMEEICKGCQNSSDILRKKSNFEKNLKFRNIKLQNEQDYYSKPEYIIEDNQLLVKYCKDYSNEDLSAVLRSFTKINYLRKGKNRTNFEKCKHIILSGKYISLSLSKDLEIKNEAKDIPFSTDIYFITNRLWYNLNKGFGKSTSIPASLDVVTKAQIVLSSELNRSIDKQYERLKLESTSGKISKEEAQGFYYNLREKVKRPEDISVLNIKESIDTIFEYDLDKYLREKSLLEEEVRSGREAIKKNALREAQENRKNKKGSKVQTCIFYYSILIVCFLVIAILPIGLYYLIKILKNDQDTPLAIIGLILAFLVEFITLFKKLKTLRNWFKKKMHLYYLRSVGHKI